MKEKEEIQNALRESRELLAPFMDQQMGDAASAA